MPEDEQDQLLLKLVGNMYMVLGRIPTEDEIYKYIFGTDEYRMSVLKSSFE